MKFGLVLLALSALAYAAPIEERDDVTVNERESQLQVLDARRTFTGTANPPSGVTLKCRTGASTSQAVRTTFGRGASLKIKCQQLGESINGNAVWNKIDRSLARDCYVSDYYTKTGYKWIPGVPKC